MKNIILTPRQKKRLLYHVLNLDVESQDGRICFMFIDLGFFNEKKIFQKMFKPTSEERFMYDAYTGSWGAELASNTKDINDIWYFNDFRKMMIAFILAM